ncbi:MAG: CAP domain-containing protein [Gaiellaceae bacterium]
MLFASAAAPARLGLTALLFAAFAAFLVTGPADGGARSANVYLAPAAACPGSTDRAASPDVQRRAVTCLINWARRQDRRVKLSPSSSLRTAAGLKGQKVAACGQLSHTPCGTNLIGPLKASGYRYASFGENLYVGAWGIVSARDVVSAWLNSSGHRENVLRPYFRDVGVSFVRAQGIVNAGPEVVWVATFGSTR